jgi:hypothetical protein
MILAAHRLQPPRLTSSRGGCVRKTARRRAAEHGGVGAARHDASMTEPPPAAVEPGVVLCLGVRVWLIKLGQDGVR